MSAEFIVEFINVLQVALKLNGGSTILKLNSVSTIHCIYVYNHRLGKSGECCLSWQFSNLVPRIPVLWVGGALSQLVRQKRGCVAVCNRVPL